MANNGKYMDEDGLATLWSLILTKFQRSESGKGLSQNDFTDAEKAKLAGIAEGAEPNVQSDWAATDSSSDSYILNKPTAMKNPSALTAGGKTYDGSAAVTITAGDVGAYTKAQTDAKFTSSVKYSVVTALPATGQAGTIYLTPATSPTAQDAYDEYMWVAASGGTAAHFEKIGTTAADLSQYLKRSEYVVDSALSATSSNPVRNSAVKTALDEKVAKADYLTYSEINNICV